MDTPAIIYDYFVIFQYIIKQVTTCIMQAGSFQKKFPNLTLKGKVILKNAFFPDDRKNAGMHSLHIPALFVLNKPALTK